MTQTVYIATRLPSLNDLLEAAKVRKGNWSGYAERKAMYGSICKADIRSAKLKPVTGPVSLHFLWMEPNKKRDKDNIAAGGCKIVIDSLVAAGILKNDGWKQITSITHEWITVKTRPGVQVVIHEAD